MFARTLDEVPIYPQFASFTAKSKFGDSPYVCEDDDGKVAYVSFEAKEKFLEWFKLPPNKKKRKR